MPEGERHNTEAEGRSWGWRGRNEGPAASASPFVSSLPTLRCSCFPSSRGKSKVFALSHRDRLWGARGGWGGGWSVHWLRGCPVVMALPVGVGMVLPPLYICPLFLCSTCQEDTVQGLNLSLSHGWSHRPQGAVLHCRQTYHLDLGSQQGWWPQLEKARLCRQGQAEGACQAGRDGSLAGLRKGERSSLCCKLEITGFLLRGKDGLHVRSGG